MKFKITRTSCEKPNVGEVQTKISDWKFNNEYEIEISTLKELLGIINKANDNIILGYKDDIPTIEIYDDWRE